MSDLYRAGRFEPDDWTVIAADAPVPAEGKALLPLARWIAERDAFAGDNRPLGVIVQPGEDVRALAPDLSRLAVIALAFPAFTDGRGYSSARILREELGFRGELRATGDVLLDQVPHFHRCGFDALVITNGPTRAALTRGHIPDVALRMQPTGVGDEVAAGGRPWRRRVI